MLAIAAAAAAVVTGWLPAKAAPAAIVAPLVVAVGVDAVVHKPKRAIALLIVATAFAVKSIVLAAVLVFGVGALLIVLHGQGRWERIPQLSAYIAACLFMALATSISSMLSSGSIAGAFAERSIYSPLFLLALSILSYLFLDTPKDVRRVLVAVAAAGTLMAAYSLAAYVIPSLAIGDFGATRSYVLFGGLRVTTGFFEFQNEFGGFLLVTSLTTLIVLQLPQTRGHRVFWRAMLVIQVIALLLTLTLGALFALVVGIFVYAAFRYRRVTTLLAFGTILAIGGVMSVALVPSVGVKLAQVGGRASARLITYAGGLNIIGQHLLFGVGPNKVLDELKSNPLASSTALGIANYVPHNQFILTTAELGLLGLAGLLAVIVSALAPLLKGIRAKINGSDRAMWCAALALLIAFFEQNLTNNLLLHARIGAMFFVITMALRRLDELRRAEQT